MKSLYSPKDAQEDEYVVHIKCNNCLKVTIAAIKKGLTVINAIKDEACPNCGCYGTLHQVS